jgi:hypothetical protein
VESAKEMQEEVKLGYDLRVDALRKELAADAGRRAELEANMQVGTVMAGCDSLVPPLKSSRDYAGDHVFHKKMPLIVCPLTLGCHLPSRPSYMCHCGSFSAVQIMACCTIAFLPALALPHLIDTFVCCLYVF